MSAECCWAVTVVVDIVRGYWELELELELGGLKLVVMSWCDCDSDSDGVAVVSRGPPRQVGVGMCGVTISGGSI
jgi:hypothetical protein